MLVGNAKRDVGSSLRRVSEDEVQNFAECEESVYLEAYSDESWSLKGITQRHVSPVLASALTDQKNHPPLRMEGLALDTEEPVQKSCRRCIVS